MQSELLISCEHASHLIPWRWRYALDISPTVLRSHRGWDPGAIEVARYCSRNLNVFMAAGKWSRLLIELNRSPDHAQLWSEFSARLSPAERQRLMKNVYHPYRDKVRNRVGSIIANGKAARHFSIHSFTPVWQGIERPVDIGILLDPNRLSEVHWADCLQNNLSKELPFDWRIEFNKPYNGTDDGLTTTLRQEFGEKEYSGIELEISQRIFHDMPRQAFQLLKRALVNALQIAQEPAD